MKKVKQTLYAHEIDMGGIPVRQPLPTARVQQVDPFLLLHHGTFKVKPGTDHRHAGVGPHPHRGFSPVTFVFEGSIHHRDSRGNDGIVDAGGVQWMNAGMGIIHSERPSKALAERGGLQEIIQLWVNTPSSKKMNQPYYMAVDHDQMPNFDPDEGTGRLQLVSGSLNNVRGPVSSPVPLISVMGELSAGAHHRFTVDPNFNTMLYILRGTLRISGHGLTDALNLLVFDIGGETIAIEAIEDTRLLFLSGAPINEPMKHYGPYVMNTQSELLKAMRDYQKGKMGVLIEEF